MCTTYSPNLLKTPHTPLKTHIKQIPTPYAKLHLPLHTSLVQFSLSLVLPSGYSPAIFMYLHLRSISLHSQDLPSIPPRLTEVGGKE